MKPLENLNPVTSVQNARIAKVAVKCAIMNSEPVTNGIIEFGLRFAERYGYSAIVRELDDAGTRKEKQILA